MISASHNPVEYNGIKFFNHLGYKLRDELEEEIEDIIFHHMDSLPQPTGKDIGIKSIAEDALDDYISFCNSLQIALLKELRWQLIVQMVLLIKQHLFLLLNLKARLCIIHNEPNGININENCGSTHIQDLCAFVKENNADVGFAFDGDADRCLAVDENGQLIDGDKILAICGMAMKEQKH